MSGAGPELSAACHSAYGTGIGGRAPRRHRTNLPPRAQIRAREMARKLRYHMVHSSAVEDTP